MIFADEFSLTSFFGLHFFSGVSVGTTVGSSVGFTVGSSVGSGVDSSVGSTVVAMLHPAWKAPGHLPSS